MTLNIRASAALILALAMSPTAALAESAETLVTPLKEPEVVEVAAKPEAAHPFAAMAGSWAGGGKRRVRRLDHQHARHDRGARGI